MENEVWKDIPNYEGLYQASDLGNVRSLDRYTCNKKQKAYFIKGKILKQYECGGYLNVSLYKNGIKKRFYVHRLVANTFFKINNIKDDVNHKNGIRNDNRLKNLEFCSRSENIKHSYKILGRKPSQYDHSCFYKPINQYDLDGKFIKTYISISEAEKELKITSIGKISACCNHKYGRKTAFGYKWEFCNIPKED